MAVLGGMGFIGSHLCRALLRDGYRVRVFDKLYASQELISDIKGSVEIFEGDAMQPGEVLRVIADAEILVDLVHTTRPGSSMQDPVFDVSSNVASRVAWLKDLAGTKVRRIVFVSSGGTVYGVPRENLISEEHPTNPISSYGITKLTLEKYYAMYAELAEIDCVILRPANVYGVGSRLNNGQGVIGVLADRALRGLPLEIWGNGESRRDYLYIDDMVSAVRSVIDYHGKERIFNVSSGHGHSVNDIVELLRGVLGRLPEVIFKPDRGFDVPVNVLDTARLRNATGWRADISLATGVGRVVEWLRAPGASR